MSLVNDMLRDLDRRTKDKPDLNGASPVQAIPVEKRKPNGAFSSVLRLIIVCLVLLILWQLWERYGALLQQRLTAFQADTATVVSDKTISEKAKPIESKKPPVKPDSSVISINDIRWGGSDNGGDLVVLLNGQADVQVIQQQSENITLAFENTQLSQPLPKLASPLIKQLDVTRESDRVLLNLQTSRVSEFSFKVQSDPAAVIVGVIPKPLPTLKEEKDNKSESDAVVAKTEATKLAPVKKQASKQLIADGKTSKGSVKPATTENSATSTPVIKKAKSHKSQVSLAEIKQLIRSGQTDQAKKLLQKRIGERTDKPLASYQLLSTLHYSEKRSDLAEELISQAKAYFPTDLQLNKLLARIVIERQDFPTAISILSAQPNRGRDTEYFELLATALQNNNQPAEAAAIYHRLLQGNSLVARWWVALAYSLELDQRRGEAITAYSNALQLPDISRSLQNYARQRLRTLTQG